MYRQHSLTGKSSETLALQKKHKTFFNCLMTSHAFQKVTLQNADNSELNFLGWKKWRLLNPATAGFSGSTCKCHCHENARLKPPPLNRRPTGERKPRWPSPSRFGTAGESKAAGFWELKCFFFGSPAPKPTFQERTAKDMQRLYTTNLRCWETAGKHQVESKINESPQIWLKMQLSIF